MTAAVYRSGTPSLSVPQTQNTAPVLEFNCLYTHDIRRKQKRWQDGFLRFHTFNKRVMVYDVPRNFIGDAHWKADESLQDGDEVTLEKDGVIVQVSENVGRTETDLTELRKSKKKGSSEKGSSSPVRPARTPAPVLERAGLRPTTQSKHRSLNNLLGTPKGLIGKAALPTKSPFEQRHADGESEGWDDGRPPKRQRIDHSPTWNIARTTKTAMPRAKAETPLWARTVDSAKQKKKAPVQNGQRTLPTKEIIDLSEDADGHNRFLPGFSSDALAPPSSPKAQGPIKGPREKQSPVRSSSPVFQTQRVPTAGRRPHANAAKKVAEELPPMQLHDAPQLMLPANVELVSSEISDGDDEKCNLAMKAASVQKSKQSVSDVTQSMSTKRHQSSKSGQTLRMATSAPKKRTLLCQDQLSKKSSRVHSTNTENAIDALLDARTQDDATAEPKSKTHRRQLQERLARITKKNRGGEGDISVTHSVLRQQKMNMETAHANERIDVSQHVPQTALGQNAMELAQLDQMIMPPGRPPSPEVAPPAPESRQLRRVVSESYKPSGPGPKRVPGAAVRITPSPAKKSPPKTLIPSHSDHANSNPKQTTAPQPKPRGKKPIQRAVTLNTASNGTSTVILSKPFQTPKAPALKAAEPDKPADAWSREAFDLFTWRPPSWDEENWRIGA